MQLNQRGSERVVAVFQLRTAMVQGQTGTLSLDVRSSVDKGVSEGHRGDFTCKMLHHRLFTLFLSLAEESDVPKE